METKPEPKTHCERCGAEKKTVKSRLCRPCAIRLRRNWGMPSRS